MNPGLFIHKIDIQEPTNTADSYGGYTKTWTTKDTIWGRIVPLSGKEFIEAQKLKSDLTHNIYIRKYSDVKPNWRIKYGSRIFDIHYVMDIKEKKRYTLLRCKENIDA